MNEQCEAAFAIWKEYQLTHMKSGGHNKFWAESVYFGDLKYAFDAAWQAAQAEAYENAARILDDVSEVVYAGNAPSLKDLANAIRAAAKGDA